jgi:hypothetical protein
LPASRFKFFRGKSSSEDYRRGWNLNRRGEAALTVLPD